MTEVEDIQELKRRLAAAESRAAELAAAERSLRESEERYRTVFETMSQGYAEGEIIRDVEGKPVDIRFLDLNPAWGRYAGVPSEAARGKRAREVLPGIEDWWFETLGRVASTGTAERIEHELAPIGRWLQAYVYPRPGDRYVTIFEDITVRKHAEAALRESEERQAFLLRLSDALRSLKDPRDVQQTASRMLGGRFGVNRALYAEVMGEGDTAYASINGQYIQGVSPVPERVNYQLFTHGFPGETWRQGLPVVVEDSETDLRFEQSLREAWRTIDTRATLAVPLVKDGREVVIFGLHNAAPRAWTQADVDLLTEAVERTWAATERAIAETALRESEERFRQFANASAAGLWIRDAETLAMEFVSPAVNRIYGVEPEALLGDVKHWAARIVPEDREVAMQHLQEAREGRTVAHEFRIRRHDDQTFRWIRNTDFPLHDDGHIARIGGIAEDVSEAKLAVEHQAVLLAELQHRVRNIMAMTRSVTQRTARNAEDVSDYAALMSGRLMSLARTQALLTRAANVSVDLEALLHTELSAQAQDDSQYSLSGPAVEISPKAAEVLSLSIHELTTNALKYGAFSVAEGTINVEWHVSMEGACPVLRLQWTETRPRIANWTPPIRRGFGSELVERRVPYELDGEGRVELTPEGARVSIAFPLQPGASILETSAPVRKSVYGGSIDMGGEQILAGQRILVVEDDYLLAYDSQSALESAGATVVGPFAKEAEAAEAIKQGGLTAALTDINLGKGPSFEIAKALRQAQVPFAFLTGYDQSVIPEEFAEVPRFVKPIDTRHMVRGLSKLLQPAEKHAK